MIKNFEHAYKVENCIMNLHVVITQVHQSISSLTQFPGLEVSLFWGLRSAGLGFSVAWVTWFPLRAQGKPPDFKLCSQAGGQLFHLWKDSSFLELYADSLVQPLLVQVWDFHSLPHIGLMFPETPAEVNPKLLLSEAFVNHQPAWDRW